MGFHCPVQNNSNNRFNHEQHMSANNTLIEVSKTETAMFSIPIPHYLKSETWGWYFKIVSKNECIKVIPMLHDISICKPSEPFVYGAVECDPKEFDDAFEDVLDRINELNNKF